MGSLASKNIPFHLQNITCLWYRLRSIKFGSHVITTAKEIQIDNKLFKMFCIEN